MRSLARRSPRADVLVQRRRNHLSEAISCSVQAALHGTEVAPGDFGDLLVRLSLEFAQHEYHAVVLGQLLNGPLYEIPEMAFPEKVVRTVVVVLKLKRTVIGVPVLLDRLEQDQRATTPVAQFVLREIGRNRIDPSGELLGLIEPAHVPMHANEHLLDEVFRSLTVSDGAVYEIQQPLLVPTDQLVECPHATGQVLRHDPGIVPIVERGTRLGLSGFGRDNSRTVQYCSHLSTPRMPGRYPPTGTLYVRT